MESVVVGQRATLITTKAAELRVEALLRALQPHIHKREQLAALYDIFDVCHWDHDLHFRMYQNALCNAGGVDKLVNLVQGCGEDLEIMSWVFTVLGQAGFNNTGSSEFVGSHRPLLTLVIRILSNHDIPGFLHKNAIYSLTNSIANVWTCHTHLQPLIPHLVAIVRTAQEKSLKAQAVLTLGNFAYNPSTHVALLESDALPGLHRTMLSEDPELMATSAAIALANILGNSHSLPALQPSAPPPTKNELLKSSVGQSSNGQVDNGLGIGELPEACLDLVVNALQATLGGRDYPDGSCVYYTDWKLINAIRSLAGNPIHRTHLARRGLASLLSRAIQRHTTHPPTPSPHSALDSPTCPSSQAIVAMCLHVLWDLSL